MEYVDPTDIQVINERVRDWAAPDDHVYPVHIDRVVIAEAALDALVEVVRERSGGKRVLVVMDHTPMRRGTSNVKAAAVDAMARVCEPVVRALPDEPGRRLHADLVTARQLFEQLAADSADFGAIVSIGSGTVTDLAKYARHLHAEQTGHTLPFVSFPTAASVTAYTSALAVMTVDGVKRTLPARAPDAVVCDLRTLADAPRVLTQAGFGDVLARSVSYGDWFLANELGMDDGFSAVPGKLLEHAETRMLEHAKAIPFEEPEGVRSVTDALLLSGMAMSIVRQTAPLSGWEHAISHFLDLTAAGDRRIEALHGGQVGVATLISAKAYESAWRELDLERLSDTRDDAFYRHMLEQVFGSHDASGGLMAEIWSDVSRKLALWRGAGHARRRFVERKRAGEYDPIITRLVRPARDVEQALHEAGAPMRFLELDQPIEEDRAASAVRFAHMIRARFTLGDLLFECGALDGFVRSLSGHFD